MAEEERHTQSITELRIPREKIAFLKRLAQEIEQRAKVKLEIGEDGSVRIRGDALSCWTVKHVVKALARGFAKEDAFLLFEEDKMLYVIPIAKERNKLVRIRARIIGTKGKMKKEIERITGCKLAIHGRTVSIIGSGVALEVARTAVEKLIHGASHSKVLSYLKRAKVEIEGDEPF